MSAAIVSICGDPGGARALAPVLVRLTEDGRLPLVNYAYAQGPDVLRTHGLAVHELTADFGTASARHLLETVPAALLLTATSCNGRDLEKAFIEAARPRVLSLSVLDFWSGYRCRFGDHTDPVKYLPDTVAVMDARAKQDLAAVGAPPDRLVVTGQPAFDSLARDQRAFTSARRTEVRRALGAQADEALVLFVSQPLSKLYGMTEGDARHLGFNEHDALAALMEGLARVRDTSKRTIRLAIKPHPRERGDVFRDAAGGAVRLADESLATPRECLMAADLVAGMNSVLLVEACYLGRMVLSIQPNLRQPDALPSNAWGASRAVYRVEDVAAAVDALLFDPLARSRQASQLETLVLDTCATDRVVDRVYAALGHSRPTGVRT